MVATVNEIQQHRNPRSWLVLASPRNIVIMYSRSECCYYLPFIKLFQLRDQDDEYNKEANAAAQAVFCCEFPESVLLPRRAHRVLHSGQ